jgi:hypothetical protein
MTTRVHLAATAIAIVIVTAACGQSKAATSAPGRRSPTRSSASTTAPAPVSLVLETGSPPHPPSAAFVVHSGAHDIIVNGVALVTGKWITDRSVVQATVHSLIPWPHATTIEGGDNPSIEFHTPYVPDFVVVRAYAALDEVNQVPLGYPITSFDCNQFTAPRCNVVASKSGIRVFGLDQTIYSGTYIVVYSEWHLPTKPPGSGAYAPGSLPASWLFRVIHTRATGP